MARQLDRFRKERTGREGLRGARDFKLRSRSLESVERITWRFESQILKWANLSEEFPTRL